MYTFTIFATSEDVESDENFSTKISDRPHSVLTLHAAVLIIPLRQITKSLEWHSASSFKISSFTITAGVGTAWVRSALNQTLHYLRSGPSCMYELVENYSALQLIVESENFMWPSVQVGHIRDSRNHR